MAIQNKHNNTTSLTRRVTLLTDPFFDNSLQMYMVASLDAYGFQYQIALDALPTGVTLDMIKQNQQWFVERRTTYNRLFLFIGEMSAKTSLLPGYYGSFYSTANQTSPNNPVTFNSSFTANDFEIDSTSKKIIAINAGTYNIDFSANFTSTLLASSAHTTTIWLSYNGNKVPWTARSHFSLYQIPISVQGVAVTPTPSGTYTSNTFTASGNNNIYTSPYLINANYTISLQSKDYIQIYWNSTDSTAKLTAVSGLDSVGQPSAIINVTQL